MIDVKNLEKTWRRGRTRVGLLPTSFTVPDGQVVGILGDNGAGKTTLLRAMAGLLPPKSGIALFDGKPAAKQYERISYITGEGSYYPCLLYTSAPRSRTSRRDSEKQLLRMWPVLTRKRLNCRKWWNSSRRPTSSTLSAPVFLMVFFW